MAPTSSLNHAWEVTLQHDEAATRQFARVLGDVACRPAWQISSAIPSSAGGRGSSTGHRTACPPTTRPIRTGLGQQIAAGEAKLVDRLSKHPERRHPGQSAWTRQHPRHPGALANKLVGIPRLASPSGPPITKSLHATAEPRRAHSAGAEAERTSGLNSGRDSRRRRRSLRRRMNLPSACRASSGSPWCVRTTAVRPGMDTKRPSD